MANEHLSRKPYMITDRCWWYEQDEGIDLVVEHTDDDRVYSHTETYLIPWKDIRAALGRKGYRKRRR